MADRLLENSEESQQTLKLLADELKKNPKSFMENEMADDYDPQKYFIVLKDHGKGAVRNERLKVILASLSTRGNDFIQTLSRETEQEENTVFITPRLVTALARLGVGISSSLNKFDSRGFGY